MHWTPRLRVWLFGLAVLIVYATGLDHTPPYMHHDEVVIALQAHSIATTGRDFEGRLLPLYFHMPHIGQDAWYQPAIVYFTALFLKVLPSAQWSFRFPTALLAALDSVLMFFVARRIFGAERWAWIAAILIAATPVHFLLGRVSFDFIYPVPFVLGWLLAMLVYLEHRQPWRLFAATLILGAGFYSYIASMATMPLYLAFTFFLLFANRLLTLRTASLAIAGFALPLLVLIPWMLREPTFVLDVANRYSIGTTTTAAAGQLQSSLSATFGNVASAFRFSAVADRVSLYWTFFDPAYLFLIGGYTHLQATTRLVGVFLMPCIVLIPLGLIQMATAARSATSAIVVTGFMVAPLAAVLTVREPYATSRQMSIVVFGAIIATYGVQRLASWRGVIGRAMAIGVLALLPLHFGFFMSHYFGAYHGYSAAPFEWNHREAFMAILDRNPPTQPRAVFLTTVREHHMDAFWKLALAINSREDLLAHTTYFDSTKISVDAIPAGALVLANVDDKALLEAVKTGAFKEILRVSEPADDPVFFVLERNPV